MRGRSFWLAVLVALALGLVLGYYFRRWQDPTLEERASNAAKDLKKALDAVTR